MLKTIASALLIFLIGYTMGMVATENKVKEFAKKAQVWQIGSDLYHITKQ